ncbi:hypothetical protein BDA99DRAFT_566902 [Phascolomyces articulosus]|uniref:Uncharacterized protein n=1 Tax=Phascolomyces articulosus TaxID=60185 RepID=A0AAD5JJV4_9FUNG|nr:hypothetical protein BDA99DRAFT_566902 [Phascolomyces articulosus]
MSSSKPSNDIMDTGSVNSDAVPVFEASPSFPPLLSTPSTLPIPSPMQIMSPQQPLYTSSQDFPPLFFDESEMEEQEVVEEADQDAETVAWEGDINQFEVHPTIEQQIEQVEEQVTALLCERHNLILRALAQIETRLSVAPGLEDMLSLMGDRVRFTRLLNRTFVGILVKETEGFINNGGSQLGKCRCDQFD